MKLDVTAIDVKLAEKGMTRADLAAASGMHRQSISAVLNRGSCNPATAGKLATALKVSVCEIIPMNHREV